MNLLPEPGEKTRASTSPDRFLVAYSNVHYADAEGDRCKTICVREIAVKV
ncbi:MAG: hypothetical protein K9N51_07590 [Candidatus Pacebacteria bacterium]|nr:hypothetical protein [Candidatus Paceibacterota bacterium]